MKESGKKTGIIVAITAVIVIAAVATTALLILRGKEKKQDKENTQIENANTETNDGVTRYDWINELCENFEIEPDADDAPYFDDVQKNSKYYDFVQAAAHWGLVDGKHFDGNKAVTGEYAALTALKAIGGYKIKIYLEADESLKDDECWTFAVDNKLVSEAQKGQDLTYEECLSVLERARELSFNELYKTGYSKIEWQEGVTVYETSEGLQFSGDFEGLIGADKEYKAGDVIVFPNESGAKLGRRIESINEDGTYDLATVEIDDICKSAVISDTQSITFEDIKNSGNWHEVSTKGMDAALSNMVYAGEYETTLLNTRPFNYNTQGFKIKLEKEGETLTITITNNETHQEIEMEDIPIPEELKNEDSSNFTASVDVDSILIHGILDYDNIAKINYLDVDTKIYTKVTTVAKIPKEIDKSIPLIKPIIVFESGIFQIKLGLNLVITASGEIEVEVELPSQYEFIYERGNGFRKIHDIYPPENPKYIIEAESEVFLRGEVIPGLFCVDIIDFDADIGIHAEGNITTRLNSDLAICVDTNISAPIFYLGIGQGEDKGFMLLKNQIAGKKFKYKWEIVTKDNAPFKKEAHFESRKSEKFIFKQVDKCTYNSDDADDGVYTEIKSYLDMNHYPFQEDFIIELDNDYSRYGTAAPWTDAGDYYEVEGNIYLSNPIVGAGSKINDDDGSKDLTNTTINLCGHQLETGQQEVLNRNKSVIDGIEKINGIGKAIKVESIDGRADWDVCFLYGASETYKQPSYYDKFYENTKTEAEEVTDDYYWELCEAYFEDIEGDLPDITGAWFTYWLDIPTLSEQKKIIRIRKDAVFAIGDSDDPNNPYMATMQDIYEGKEDLSNSEWSLYQWFAPNEYGFSSMERMRITFDENGLVKEVVPMVMND